jgi:hypothetical protein
MNYTWHDLNVLLAMRNERQVKAMLDEEVDVHKRPTYAVRIHQRYTTLRAQRERREILDKIARAAIRGLKDE